MMTCKEEQAGKVVAPAARPAPVIGQAADFRPDGG
jgi:hypothetical protein